jgi:hypothetical protein
MGVVSHLNNLVILLDKKLEVLIFGYNACRKYLNYKNKRLYKKYVTNKFAKD